ncbi:MAG: Uma2 family endonuclease [Thermomicrobiales bacterium]
MATVTAPSEQRIVLHDVSWDTYERLLADHLDSSAPRFTYDRRELEIGSPSTEHEQINRSMALLVELIAIEFGMDVLNVGSMTFKRRDLARGFEPDSSFYMQHEATPRDRPQIDLTVDPPPDLVIEIELTWSALPKLPIFAHLGVPEVWRWNGERLVILTLEDDTYVQREASAALPPLTSAVLTELLLESRRLRRSEWVRRIQEWARGETPR